MNKLSKYTLNGIGAGVETAVKKLAFPISVLTTTSEPGANISERIYTGVSKTGQALYNGVEALVLNDGVRDVAANLGYEVMIAAGNMAQNLKDDAETTLYTLLGTYIGTKLIPTLTRLARTGKLNTHFVGDKQVIKSY